MATLKYEGNATFQIGTLGSAYTSGGGTLALSSGHGDRFPSSGDFWVRVDDEVFKCTSRTGDTLTVTGAQDGTSASNHSSGSVVRWVLSKGALDQFRGDLVKTGAFASAATEKAGIIYLPNDGFQVLRDTGAAMAPWGPLFPFTQPVLGDFTAVNSASGAATNGGITLSAPASGSDSWRLFVKTAPATPYTITIGILAPTWSVSNFAEAALVFRQSSDGKFVTNSIGSANGYFVSKWSSVSAISAHYTNGTLPVAGPIRWLRITDNGTNRLSYWSNDGINFIQLHTIGRTDFLTADQVGFGCDTSNSVAIYMNVLSWAQA